MSHRGHVIVAPDKFKGSLSAAEVADHLRDGMAEFVPALDVRFVPVADGGEGTVQAAVARGCSAGFRPTEGRQP